MTADPPIDPSLLQQVKAILRRDLKLAADAAIADDAPLLRGDMDVDSLDLLLVVSSIERELGVTIPSESLDESVFQSVATVARHVQTHRKSAVPPPVPADPLARLPHADPFRFVTAIEHVATDDRVTAVWDVTGAEAFLAGHFPGRPIVPGVLIAEALAQAAGLTAGPGDTAGKLAHVDVRFDRPVTPPARVVLHAKLVRKVVSLRQYDVSAVVGGVTVARGTLALQLGDA